MKEQIAEGNLNDNAAQSAANHGEAKSCEQREQIMPLKAANHARLRRAEESMYVTLGDSVISDRDVVGVFDMDATTVSVRTRDFLKKAQDGGRVVNTSYELPKAFVVTKEKVYITQYNAQTVSARIEQRASRA